MKEYNKDGIKFNYKENLDETEFTTIIKAYLKVYNFGLDEKLDMIDGLHKNPILAERTFFINLGNLCIENFDLDLHKKLFEHGIYKFLIEDIINAKDAYYLAKEVSKRVDSADELIYSFLNKIIELIPDEGDINKLKETWDKVSDEYNNITKDENN